MIATIAELKKATFVARSEKDGVVSFEYSLAKGLSITEIYRIGETLQDQSFGLLKHEGREVSDEFADFDWNYKTVVVTVAVTDEGRRRMESALQW